MSILYISGEITEITVNKFIEDYNKCDKNSEIKIYINSLGGEIYHSNVILDIINANYKNIFFIACGEICSAAFNMFFSFRGPKVILSETIGMAHFCWATFELDETGKPNNVRSKFILGDMKRNKEVTLNKFKSFGLNNKELKTIKVGKDCYFSTERLNELLNNG